MKRFPYIQEVNGIDYGVELVADDAAEKVEDTIYLPADSEYGFDVIVPSGRIELVLLINGRLVSLFDTGLEIADNTSGTISMSGIPVTPATEPGANLIDGFRVIGDGIADKIDIAIYEERIAETTSVSRGTDFSNARVHSMEYGEEFRRGELIAHWVVTLTPQ